MSLDWTSSTWTRDRPNFQDEPWLQRPGEVFNEPRPYSPWPTPLGLDYAHVCGTEDDFVKGAKYDPDIDVKYDEQGLPLCCNGPAVPLFPMELGFSATLEADTPGGTCVTGGRFDVGDWVEFTIPDGAEQWWKSNEVANGTYSLEITDPPSATSSLFVDWILGPPPECVFLISVFTTSSAGALCHTIAAGFSPVEQHYLRWVNGTGAAQTYRFRVKPGTC